MTNKYLTGSSTPAGLISTIQTAVTSAGLGWTSPTAGRLVSDLTGSGGAKLDILLSSMTTSALSCLAYHTGTASTSVTMNTGNTNASGPIRYELSISEQHFFLIIEGPYSGEVGAVTASGSYREFLGYMPFSAWDASDTDANERLALISSQSVQVAGPLGSTGSKWSSARLIWPQGTQGISGLANPTAGGKVMTFPYDVVDNVSGPRGRLQQIRFCQERPVYDEYLYANRHFVDSGGTKWRVVGLHRPLAATSTPLGKSADITQTNQGTGWPLVVLPED